MGQPVSEFSAAYYELRLFAKKAGGGRWEASIKTPDGQFIKDQETYGFEDDAKSAAVDFGREYMQEMGDKRPPLEHVEWLPVSHAMSA